MLRGRRRPGIDNDVAQRTVADTMEAEQTHRIRETTYLTRLIHLGVFTDKSIFTLTKPSMSSTIVSFW